MLAEPVGIQPECVRVGSHPGERGLRRLLHDIAELSGDRQPSFPRIGGRLEEQDVATYCGEGETGGDTGVRGALAHLALVASRAEPGPNLLLVDAQLLRA